MKKISITALIITLAFLAGCEKQLTTERHRLVNPGPGEFCPHP